MTLEIRKDLGLSLPLDIAKEVTTKQLGVSWVGKPEQKPEKS